MNVAASPARVPAAIWAVMVGGVAAALHVGKLPPALPTLQVQLHASLLESGFLLSLVQLAGMSLGLVAGLAADATGLRRSMLLGLLLLSAASLAGGFAGLTSHPVGWLLAWRALEGIGFLLAVMPGPALMRRLAPRGVDKAAMGMWGAYMPLGVALALLVGPWVIVRGGWAIWWQGLAALSALAALVLWLTVPVDAPRVARPIREPAADPSWRQRLLHTVWSAGPWRVSIAFALYSAQWMALIGFLPTICADAGLDASVTAWLTAFAAALNMVGNIAGGRLLERGWMPVQLLWLGFAGMALASLVAFVQIGGPAAATALPPLVRYLAICVFSLCGGLVPATLFMLAVRVAPGPTTVSTTVGLMQQASSLGQFLAPPLVAWLAHRVGGWQWTWAFTLVCSLAGIAAGRALASVQQGRLA